MDNHDNNIEVELKYIRRDLDEIKAKLSNNYITKNEFAPVRNLVYGLVGLILTSFIGALVTLVLKS
jgi:hypothetical protein